MIIPTLNVKLSQTSLRRTFVGPFETHTGHGMGAAWEGQPTWALEGRTIVRIDLDPALEKVWQAERDDKGVQEAINLGRPKTKQFEVPFRMEMSGFARLEGSLAVTGDIGVVWPVMARRLAQRVAATGKQPSLHR